MEWALGNQISIRTIAVGCAVVTVVTAVAITRPKVPALPHLSFSIGAAAPADASAITISRTDAASAISVVTSIDDVHSEEDLVSYADFMMQGDPRITQIQINDHSVSMTYVTDNRILNMKTVASNTKATVGDDGMVTIAGSWIRPLFTHVAQASSPDIGFSDISMAEQDGALSPQTEAHILARLHGRFQIGAIQ